MQKKKKKCLSLPFLLLLHQLWIQGNLLQFRFSKLATQKIPQEFPLQICFLLSSTSFLVHMFHICLGACVRASSSPAHSLLWRSLENWVFFVTWSIMCRLRAPRDLILYRKRSVSMWKALGKLPAALRNAILPSSDDENGHVWAGETKSFLANLHWDSEWKKLFLFSSDLGIWKPTIIIRRALVAVIRREGCSRTTERVKLPLFSMNSADGKPAALREQI